MLSRFTSLPMHSTLIVESWPLFYIFYVYAYAYVYIYVYVYAYVCV